ncbi:Rv3235 family protein [Cellulosimicrobium protaetiae]|uniref:Energy transducer TonB n=1 Tax=Cellulosimicrobium protaetiae TaxID=2587808 RepID=A0A6M5UG27_9MICO|nr:Rv3235 family protein [Cellulosimicrobium protaetiae]QJW36143.1 energy transducer TonB [Cellulosimicrobium protaetiae]
MTAPLLTDVPLQDDVDARTTTDRSPRHREPSSTRTRPVRATSVPADARARLLRCVGERAAPAVDLTDPGATVPRHVVRGRPLAPPTSPVPLPDPTALCCAVVRAAVEVLRGERTVSQLARWVSPEIYETLARRARIVADGPRETTTRPAAVLRARVLRIGEGVAEGTVVVEDGDRVRAAAARLEARRGAWRVVALEIG